MISPFKCSTRDAHTAQPIRNDNTFPFNPYQAFVLLVPPINSTRSSGHLFGRSCAASPHLFFLPERVNGHPFVSHFRLDCGKYTHHRAITYHTILGDPLFTSESTGPTVYLPRLYGRKRPVFQRSLCNFGTVLTPRDIRRPFWLHGRVFNSWLYFDGAKSLHPRTPCPQPNIPIRLRLFVVP